MERHDKLEAMIGDALFLVGDRPTLADGVFVGVARWLDFHQVADAQRWPRLSAVRHRIESDSAVAFATAIENGDTPSGSGSWRGHVPLPDVIDRFGMP